MSDYLWDKSGGDPEIQRLETALRPLAYSGAPPVLPHPRPRLSWWLAGAGAAAALMALLVWRPWCPQPPASIDGRAVVAGEWLESGAATLHLGLGALGSLDLAPSTRARMLVWATWSWTTQIRHGEHPRAAAPLLHREQMGGEPIHSAAPFALPSTSTARCGAADGDGRFGGGGARRARRGGDARPGRRRVR